MSQIIGEPIMVPKNSKLKPRIKRDSNHNNTDVSQLESSAPPGSRKEGSKDVRSSKASTETKSALGRVSPHSAVACIDTLSAITLDAIDEREIEDLISSPLVKPCRQGEGFTLGHKGNRWWFKILEDKRIVISTNDVPLKFSSLRSQLSIRFGAWALRAKVTRLDCAVTFPLTFQELFVGLDFGTKRSAERYLNSDKGRSVYIGRKGKRNECLIYDKQKKSLQKKDDSEWIEHACTRIEINSIPKVDGQFKVSDIPKLIGHTPFKHIKRYDIEFIEPKGLSGKTTKRFAEFEILCEIEGLWQAKRTLSKRCNRNFEKLYRRFYKQTLIKPSLNDIFQMAMKEFFS